MNNTQRKLLALLESTFNPEGEIHTISIGNFYVGFGDYECGISTASGQSAWRWFANSGKVTGTDAGGSFGEFSNSQKVNIRLELVFESGKTYKVKFYVNNTHWHTFSPAYTATSSFSDGRVVLGAAQQTYPINGVPATLPAWKIFHTQVKRSVIRRFSF